MKKVVLLFTAVVLAASMTFAQTPQDKSAKPAPKTETVKKETPKDHKGGCDEKTKAACQQAKSGKGCCSHDAKKPAPAPATPEKK